MLIRMLVLFLIMLVTSSVCMAEKPTGTALKYDVGDTLPEGLINRERYIWSMDPSFHFTKTYIVLVDSIKFTVSFGERKTDSDTDGFPNVIEHLGTGDHRFTTPEDLKVGDPFRKALDYTDEVIIDERLHSTWVMYAKLPSGWNAVISASRDSIIDPKTIPDRKIISFFRTIYDKRGTSTPTDNMGRTTLDELEKQFNADQ